MKILMVNKFLYPNGGSETYIFKLGKYLKLKGHDVQYFGMEDQGRCVGNDIDVYTSDMDFHNATIFSKVTYALKTIYSKEAKQKIKQVLENFQPDVVHLNNFNYQLTPSIILGIKEWEKKSNYTCKIIFTAHDYQIICPNHMLYNPNLRKNCEECLIGNFKKCLKNKCIHGSTMKSFIGMLEAYFWNYNKVYKNIDRIICCSQFMKKKLDLNPILAKKTIAMHNFIDRISWQKCEKKNYVLYFGRYSQEKGIKTLIKVCSQLKNINFIFAGNGPLEKEINEVENITNVGFKSGDELRRLIQEAKFSIYPSEWYENCPFSVMESQLYGTPVLGANIGGIPELIDDNKTGLLFESGNMEDLENKIKYLWENENLLSMYSENCRNVKFDTLEEYYAKIINFYK